VRSLEGGIPERRRAAAARDHGRERSDGSEPREERHA
jgi:hypothetical protein